VTAALLSLGVGCGSTTTSEVVPPQPNGTGGSGTGGSSATGGAGGGHAGGAGAVPDVAGYYVLWMTWPGDNDEEPWLTLVQQDGASLTTTHGSGTIDATGAFVITMQFDVHETLTLAGTFLPEGGFGAFQVVDTLHPQGSGSGPFKLAPVQANGTLSLSGTVEGQVIQLSGLAGIGIHGWDDMTMTVLDSVVISATDMGHEVWMQIERNPGTDFGVGTFNIGQDVHIFWDYITSHDTIDIGTSATGGSVMFSTFDGSAMAGSLQLTADAGSLTGSFDLQFEADWVD